VRRVEPNWPAPFYTTALVLTVGMALQRFAPAVRLRVTESQLRRAVTVGALAAALAYLLPFGLGLQGTPLDPAVRLRGWRECGTTVAQQFAALPVPQRSFVLVTAGRAVASELAFYMPHQPRVYLWTAGGAVLSQYDIWDGPSDKRDWDALIVTPAGTAAPSELQAAFVRVEDRGEIDVPISARRHHRYHLWRGVELRRWPDQHRTNVAHAGSISQVR